MEIGEMGDGVLAGLKVLDLSRNLSSAVCAMQLAEAGAAVTRIVAPGDDPVGANPGFAVWHRGKARLTLNLEEAAGLERLERELASADILVHDLGPSAAAALRLDDSSLNARFPELIVAGVPTWPQSHPLADAPWRETLVLARLGILDEQRGHRPGPIFVRLPIGAWCAAWLSAIAVVARLIHRQATGLGGPAHTSLAQGSLTSMIQLWARASRPSESFTQGMPKTQPWTIFQCSDGGWIHPMGSPDEIPSMQAALTALGQKGVAEANGRWPSFGVRLPNGGANAEIFLTRPAQAWLEEMWAHDIPVQYCANLGDVYFDEQARTNGYVVEVEDPIYGRTLQPGVPIRVAPPSRVRAREVDEPASGHRNLGEGRQNRRRTPPQAPLAGLKVLDFGSFMAGPFGPQCMAELGAEVVKVEAVTGDPKRFLHRNFAGSCRGKRSVALDLRDARSRPALEALVRWADVVHHNIRAPAARRLGIDFERLKAINPKLIYCHVTAYGPIGPRANWPGYDQMFQSSLGWETAGGGEGNPPIWYRFGTMDVLCAMCSTFATELALYHRNRTGEGQAVATSLLGATALTAGESLGRPNGTVLPYAQLDGGQMGVSKHHSLYACADDWIATAAVDDGEIAAFDALCGEDPEGYFRERSAGNALAALAGAGVPAELVHLDAMAEFLDNPDHRASGMIVTYAESPWGRLEQIGRLWDFGELPLNFRYPAPDLGQHSVEVLRQVGVTGQEIDALLAEGLLAQAPEQRSTEPEKLDA